MKNLDYIYDTKDDVFTLINSNNCINYGPLSLCKVKRFSDRNIQIDCDCKELHFSQMFEDFDEAFSKFLELRKKLRTFGYIIDFKEKVKPILLVVSTWGDSMKFEDPKEFSQLKPYEIIFNNHYAVWQCKDEKHALERARETYKQKTVLLVREL